MDAKPVKTYAYYADLCKSKNIPLVYERDTTLHKKGQSKTKEALRKCLYQKTRDRASLSSSSPGLGLPPKMQSNPLYKQSYANPAFVSLSSPRSSPLQKVVSPPKPVRAYRNPLFHSRS